MRLNEMLERRDPAGTDAEMRQKSGYLSTVQYRIY
jgi:hypothetical protein